MAIKKVAVVGLGAIGGVVISALRSKGLDVISIGKPQQKKVIDQDGLIVDGVRGHAMYSLSVGTHLAEKVDLVILTMKTQDMKDAVERSREYFEGAVILSTQNGVRADKLLSMMLGEENLISSIVMFGATYEPYNKIIHNFEGKWFIGRPFGPNDEKVGDVVEFLSAAFEVEAVENVAGMKWTKLFINFSNCLPALVGKSMQETYSDLRAAQLSLKLIKEGFEIIEKCGISLVDMPDFEVEKFKALTKMPLDEAAKIYSGIMMSLSKEPLYGSILQSIKRERPTEIDYINGEVVNQARLKNIEAKLNACAVELVHAVEQTKKFYTIDNLVQRFEDAESVGHGSFL